MPVVVHDSFLFTIHSKHIQILLQDQSIVSLSNSAAPNLT